MRVRYLAFLSSSVNSRNGLIAKGLCEIGASFKLGISFRRKAAMLSGVRARE
jgi:hypothetical protein